MLQESNDERCSGDSARKAVFREPGDKAGHTVLIRFHKTGNYVSLACLCLHDTS